MSIPNQAVGSAASAVFNEINEWYPLEGVPNLADHAKTLATAALTAAAPHIQAAALRDAADAIDARRPTTGSNAMVHHRWDVMTLESNLLRARADQLEGETK